MVRVWGLGIRVRAAPPLTPACSNVGVGSRVWSLMVRVWGLGIRVRAAPPPRPRVRVWGLEIRV